MGSSFKTAAQSLNGCCSSKKQTDVIEHKNTDRKPKSKFDPADDGSSSADDWSQNGSNTNSDGEPSSNTNNQYKPEQLTKVVAGFKDAVDKGNDSLVSWLLRDSYGKTNLMDIEWNNGNSCLHVAVQNKHYNLILFLLKKGASPNKQNPINGNTAMHIASKVREEKTVRMLLAYDGDPNVMNRKFETPITISTKLRDDDIIPLLTKKAFDCGVDDSDSDSSDPDYVPLIQTNIQDNVTLDATVADLLDDNVAQSIHTKVNEYEEIKRMSTLSPQQKYLESLTDDQYNALPFEFKLDDDQKQQLAAMRVAKSNPFSKIKVTQSDSIRVHNDLVSVSKLPQLEAFLEKRTPRPPYGWNKRWVMVKGSYLLWSDKMKTIKDVNSIKQRSGFKGTIDLRQIIDILPVPKTKNHRKFIIKSKKKGNKIREVRFKCASKTDRNYWINGVKQYIEYNKNLTNYL